MVAAQEKIVQGSAPSWRCEAGSDLEYYPFVTAALNKGAPPLGGLPEWQTAKAL
jgi:hypothetical protein